jgi:hypothetical protein
MLTPDVMKVFASLDTGKQVAALRRTGLETKATDDVMGYLAGNHPERYSALVDALDRGGL